MAEIPTYIARNSPDTGTGEAAIRTSSAGAAATILGESLRRGAAEGAEAASGAFRTSQYLRELTERQQNVIADLEAQKTRQIEVLQSKRLASQLHTDWNNRLIQYDQNPTPDLLKTATAEYDDYVNKMLGDITSDNVRNEVSLDAAQYRIGFINDAYRLQSKQQLQAFGATFDGMMSNAEDSIFASKSFQEVAYQKQLLNSLIDESVQSKQIVDSNVIQNLKDKVDLLSISWAEANLPHNPEMVKAVISDTEMTPGLTANQRATILNKADDVVKTKDSQLKLTLRKALESDIKQRITTGKGESLDLTQFSAAFGEEAARFAKRDLDNATKLYEYSQRAMGASESTLTELEKQAKPKAAPNSDEYGDQQDLYVNVQKLVEQARSDKKDDTYTYFTRNPALKSAVEAYRENPTAEGLLKLQDEVLELQKMDDSLQPYEYKVMPKEQAEKFISSFNLLTAVGNKTDGEGVREELIKFTQLFGDKANIAIQQLNQVKGGEKITPKINPLLWHLDNPTVFRMIVDAIRKDPQEQLARFESDKVRKNFFSEVRTDSNVMLYANAITAANNSSEASNLVDGVNQAFRDFSRDYVLNGGDVEEASRIFFSRYTFGERNGVAYNRPLVYTDGLGVQHTMSPEQIRISNSYLDSFPEVLSPEYVDPKSILPQTEGFTQEEINNDIRNALSSNTFWSTTSDQTGVYLFTKGSMFGEPKQVFYKDGKPIRINFVDTMQRVNSEF